MRKRLRKSRFFFVSIPTKPYFIAICPVPSCGMGGIRLAKRHYFTIDVTGLRSPLYPTRNAFADPNFKNMSRRTGIWLASSLT